MKHLQHLGTGYPVSRLVDELDAHPELWNQITRRTVLYNSPHDNISDIWVRYNDLSKFPADVDLKTLSEPHDPVWYPAATILKLLKPLIFDVMRRVEGERLGAVLITKIPPGSRVRPHTDGGWHAAFYEKFAVQLKAAPEQAFCFEDGEFVSKPGDLYRFDNQVLHWVTNDSDVDRITLICCIKREVAVCQSV